MSNHLKAGTLALTLCIAAISSASASTVNSNVDQLVNDCAYSAGVRGSYHVTPVKYGSVTAYSVPPGADVTRAQSQRINQCVANGVKAKPRRAAATRPSETSTCLAEYKHKLRTTDNGRGYRGDNRGTWLVSGLFGRRLGRQLIENEYDRCLNRIAYLNDRCPTGLFTGGAGYCIKRPYR